MGIGSFISRIFKRQPPPVAPTEVVAERAVQVFAQQPAEPIDNNRLLVEFRDQLSAQAESQKHNEGWADEVWSSIIANDGSVQHIDWMDDWTKDVFKTSMEIDQRWVVQHASDRQEYIDQAQSLNVFFRPDSHIKYIHAVHFQAWKQGLKTMYYCRSDKIAKADKVSKRIEREVIKEIDLHALTEGNDCLACEG